MGCGVPNPGSACHHPAEHEASSSNNDATASRTTVHSEAQFFARSALERIIRAATGDAVDLQAEEEAQVSAAAAAAAAAAFAAAEEQDAGVFRAVRVHDAAVLCAGVMLCATTTRSFRVFVPNSSISVCRYDCRVVFMSGGADGRLVMCRWWWCPFHLLVLFPCNDVASCCVITARAWYLFKHIILLL